MGFGGVARQAGRIVAGCTIAPLDAAVRAGARCVYANMLMLAL
jgi:hypothetical protein